MTSSLCTPVNWIARSYYTLLRGALFGIYLYFLFLFFLFLHGYCFLPADEITLLLLLLLLLYHIIWFYVRRRILRGRRPHCVRSAAAAAAVVVFGRAGCRSPSARTAVTISYTLIVTPRDDEFFFFKDNN